MTKLKMPFTFGRPETDCGCGSKLENTINIRQWLPKIFRELEIRTLLDAPCGDFNWMSQTDLSGVHYIGIDYDKEHCRRTETRESADHFGPLSKKVIRRELCRQHLPRNADLMLCRDFLQHLPNVIVADVLRNFLRSNIPWLVATSHTNEINTDIQSHGMFRALNLTIAPFYLPQPSRSVADGPGHILGLWHNREVVING